MNDAPRFKCADELLTNSLDGEAQMLVLNTDARQTGYAVSLMRDAVERIRALESALAAAQEDARRYRWILQQSYRAFDAGYRLGAERAREECAKVCEEIQTVTYDDPGASCAAAIRALKEKP